MCSARWSGCRSRTARRLGPELPPRTRWAYDDEGARPVGVRTPGVLGILLCGGETIAVGALQLPSGTGASATNSRSSAAITCSRSLNAGGNSSSATRDCVRLRVRRRDHAGSRSHRTLEALGDVDSVRIGASVEAAGELRRFVLGEWVAPESDHCSTLTRTGVRFNEPQIATLSSYGSLSSELSAIDAVRLKLGRADRHLLEFAEAFGAYYARRPMHLEGHFDEQRSQWVTTIRVTESPPNALGPIIGDIAHNTRSALDQLTWQLALLKTAAPYRRTQFPILVDPDAYAERRETACCRAWSCPRASSVEGCSRTETKNRRGRSCTGSTCSRTSTKHREMHFANSALMEASTDDPDDRRRRWVRANRARVWAVH